MVRMPISKNDTAADLDKYIDNLQDIVEEQKVELRTAPQLALALIDRSTTVAVSLHPSVISRVLRSTC
jgi:hypothetical protein